MHERSRRLFFALWPTSDLRSAIDAAIQAHLEGRRARRISAANFHVTLAFLGSAREALLPDIEGLANEIDNEPFEITFDQIETWKRAQLLCLSATAVPKPLAALVEQLRSKLLRLQFESDYKEFKPHVTLARDWHDAKVAQPIGPFIWRASELTLVESHTGPQGSRYEVLRQWPFERQVPA